MLRHFYRETASSAEHSVLVNPASRWYCRLSSLRTRIFHFKFAIENSSSYWWSSRHNHLSTAMATLRLFDAAEFCKSRYATDTWMLLSNPAEDADFFYSSRSKRYTLSIHYLIFLLLCDSTAVTCISTTFRMLHHEVAASSILKQLIWKKDSANMFFLQPEYLLGGFPCFCIESVLFACSFGCPGNSTKIVASLYLHFGWHAGRNAASFHV